MSRPHVWQGLLGKLCLLPLKDLGEDKWKLLLTFDAVAVNQAKRPDRSLNFIQPFSWRCLLVWSYFPASRSGGSLKGSSVANMVSFLLL